MDITDGRGALRIVGHQIRVLHGLVGEGPVLLQMDLPTTGAQDLADTLVTSHSTTVGAMVDMSTVESKGFRGREAQMSQDPGAQSRQRKKSERSGRVRSHGHSGLKAQELALGGPLRKDWRTKPGSAGEDVSNQGFVESIANGVSTSMACMAGVNGVNEDTRGIPRPQWTRGSCRMSTATGSQFRRHCAAKHVTDPGKPEYLERTSPLYGDVLGQVPPGMHKSRFEIDVGKVEANVGSFTLGTQSVSELKKGLQAAIQFVAQVAQVLVDVRGRPPRKNGIRVISRAGGAAGKFTDQQAFRRRSSGGDGFREP